MDLLPLKSDLQSLSNPAKIIVFKRFFKTGPGQYGEGDQFLGLTVPQIRSLSNRYWSKLSLANLSELLQSPYHEYRTLALVCLCRQFEKFPRRQRQIFDFYLARTRRINNWDLVDISSPRIIGAYLFEQKDRSILYKLAQSKNLWERRIAIISTLYFIKNHQFSDTLSLAKILLDDPHDLIHKAVGWMLREVGKRDQKTLFGFLDLYTLRLPRTALRYAIERLSVADRKHFLHLS